MAGGFATEAMDGSGPDSSKGYRWCVRTRATMVPVSNEVLARRRRTPTQERSRETVDGICAAASTIT